MYVTINKIILITILLGAGHFISAEELSLEPSSVTSEFPNDLEGEFNEELVDEFENVLDEEKVVKKKEEVKNDRNIEDIERQLAAKDFKPIEKNPEGVLKSINNISNGNKDNKVLVEPRNVIPVARNSSKMEMVPYRIRRKDWGQFWGLSYGLFQPNNYVLDQSALTYDQVDAKSIGLISFEFTLKYNLSFMSAGIFTSIGYFKSTLTDPVTQVESELTFIPFKVGLLLELDTLFSEPYIVPYGNVGVFASQYSEETDFTSVDGTSFLALYATAGLMFQLDWIDDIAARIAYQDGGIENTFLFVEANYMSTSLIEIDESSAKDPDLSSLYYSAGVKLEF